MNYPTERLYLKNLMAKFVLKLTNKTFTSLFLLVCLLASGCVKQNNVSNHNSQNYNAEYKKSSTICIIDTAKRYLGVNYKLGGNSPIQGFDCSGFLVWTYNLHGVSLPRTAKEQMKIGKPVNKAELQPGDIVGFKIRRGYHTGMYIGNGEFIHSPSKGKFIRIDKLNSDYWVKKFVTARRLDNKSVVAMSSAPIKKDTIDVASYNKGNNKKSKVVASKKKRSKIVAKKSSKSLKIAKNKKGTQSIKKVKGKAKKIASTPPTKHRKKTKQI